MLKVLELSELFEPNRNEINRIESNSEYALNSRVSLYIQLYYLLKNVADFIFNILYYKILLTKCVLRRFVHNRNDILENVNII